MRQYSVPRFKHFLTLNIAFHFEEKAVQISDIIFNYYTPPYLPPSHDEISSITTPAFPIASLVLIYTASITL